MSNSNGFKQTDIGTIPNEWEMSTLAEVMTIQSESTQPTSNGKSKYVGLEHIDSGNPSLKRWGTEGEVRSSKNKFYAGDILYGKLRPYLDKVVLAQWEGMCATDILVFRAKQEKAVSEYLVNLLHTSELLTHAISTTTGVNHPRTSWHALQKFSFGLPPLPEQCTIAAILSKIQQAIETQEKIIERTKELKKSLMAKLFTEGLHGEELKETEIGLMPKSWEVVELRDVIEVKSGKRLPKGLELVEHKTPFPYIRIVDMKNNSVDVDGMKYLLPEIRERIRKYIITADDVYISIAGTTGLVGIIPQVLSGANLTENAARLVMREKEKLSKRFLMYSLDAEFGKKQVKVLTTKTSQPKLALSRIETIKMGLPRIDEQSEIVESLTSIDSKVLVTEAKRVNLQSLFKSMLHQLMTGTIRVKNIELPS